MHPGKRSWHSCIQILLFFFFLQLVALYPAQGQDVRQLSDTGNGLDPTGIGNGSSESRRDSTVSDRKTPKDVRAWTVTSTLGEVVPTEPDTVINRFQNVHFTDGINGEYNHLGNMGSPRLSRIFFHRPFGDEYLFADPMDYFLTSPDQFRFIDTKSPYTNVSYYRAGNKINGEERIKGNFAVNAGRRIGVGFNLDYAYGRGLYSNQSTSLFDAALYGYYRGEHYGMHLLLNYDKLKWAENGGLTDDRYITRPEDMSSGKQTYSPANMPVEMDRSWNENNLHTGFFEQHLNIGYYKSITDSLPDTVLVRHEFVPVMKAFHTANVKSNRRRFIDYRNPSDFYANTYLPYDSIDATGFLNVRNAAGLTLIEGINKWIPFGASAYALHDYRSFTLPDTLSDGSGETVSRWTEQSLSIGANLRRTIGDVLHFDVTGELAMLGDDLGAFSLEGNGDLNFRLFGDTVHLAFDGFMKNYDPSFYYRHYHSQHFWWDNDLSMEFRTHVGGSLAFDRLHTRLSAGVENIKNYTYLAFSGFGEQAASGASQYYEEVTARQYTGNIQVLSATLNQDFALGILHWDNEITAQYSSQSDILPLPLVNVYSNLYLKFTYAKVLRIELGADVRYFTAYYAPTYCPGLGMYSLQNTDPETRVLIGNYPIANAYANFHLKQCRFYVMFSHVNDGLMGNGNSFLVPHYPINPRWFKLGLSWNFWD